MFLLLSDFALVAGPAAADKLRPGPGAEQNGAADMVQAQPHRYGYVTQVHSDERAADIQSRMGADVFHRRGMLGETGDRIGMLTVQAASAQAKAA